jgi:hypothetical protein
MYEGEPGLLLLSGSALAHVREHQGIEGGYPGVAIPGDPLLTVGNRSRYRVLSFPTWGEDSSSPGIEPTVGFPSEQLGASLNPCAPHTRTWNLIGESSIVP